MKKVLIVGAVVLALGAGGTAVVATTSAPASTAALGTTVGGLAVGGLNRAALTDLLTRTAAAAPAVVTAVTGDRKATVTAADLGLRVDVAATVDKVLADSGAGRTFGVLAERKGTAVAPVVTRDQAVLDRTATRIVKAAERPESHGEVRFRDGAIVVVPPSDGQKTDAQAVDTALSAAALRLPMAAMVTVPVEVVPMHLTLADLEPLAEAARRLVAAPFVLQAGALRSTMSGASLGEHLTLRAEGKDPGHGIALALKPSTTADLAEPAAEALSLAPREPTVSAPAPQSLLSEKGNATWRPVRVTTTLVTPGQTGQDVTAAQVLAALTSYVGAGTTATAPLVLTAMPKPPATSDAQARAVNATLGTFTTTFACCQPRVTNIALIARTINGTLIGPGKTFSLNGIVGKRTRAKGYVEAPFILDGELSKDIGGGVSQFATTTLNAAFFAGVQLDRFQPHSFYISRYPAGREATVNFPGIDLKWTNNTGAAVLVRTATTGTSLTVSLYGSDDGRTVTAITGSRTPVRGRDFRITITRKVAVPGKPVRQESFRTTYNKPPEH